MDSSAAPAVLSFSLSPAPDDPTRAKFLCRFGGWVLPRPPDGKLQYVGGETRIVSVPRSVTYGELMARARELFEGTWSLKYQQPGEDVDALVSVVDDHDVANMMEEHDKLGAGRDGPRRLRVFLFSRADCVGGGSASAMGAHDEREAEKRYVDALNGLTDGDSQVPGDVVGGGLVDGGGIYGGGDAGFHGLFKPHHLDVALQHSDGQRYKDMEGPWSPASCSPGLRTPRDPPEFPPSSRQCDSGFGEANDRTLDEYVRQLSPRQALQYEHQPFFVDDAVWMPPGYIPGEKAGFPGDLGNMHNFYESDCVCDHCRMAFQRNQAAFPEDWIRGPWRHRHPQLEQLNKGSGFQRQEKGWILQQHLMNHSPDEAKMHQIEYFAVDNNGMKLPFAYDNFYDRHSVTPNCNSHGDPGYVCSAAVLGNAVYNDQQLAGAGTCMRVQDKRAHLVKSPVYGSDDIYQVEPGSSHITSLGRKMQGVCAIPSHVVPGLAMRTDGALNVGYIGNTQDGSPRFSHNGVDAQIPSPWVVKSGNTSQKIFPVDDHLSREYYYDHASKSHQGNEGTLIPEAVPRQCGKGDDYSAPNGAVNVAVPSALLVGDRSSACPPPEYDPNPAAGADITIPLVDEIIFIGGAYETNDAKVIFETSNANVINGLDADKILANDKQDSNSDPKESWTLARGNNSSKFCFSNEYGPCEQQELSAECLTFLPELIDSVKKATLEDIEMLKLKAEANVVDNTSPDYGRKNSSLHSSTHVVASAGVDVNLDTEHMTISKIEPTMAEAEALDKGLQSIKNADLEEIRELGSGAYGSVYHGKWKGCDVAIKRIKASCFAGRPSERERLIADFWKEALIMSSLHHPNIVSFYGIVRDGPDGSLATVTEFMVNGSLKQFLQKKDRSIDRRKRLIIAMDVAFGMEYLHGKNIVHFDLKCENLLVNMRDPHRPVCKIGDLGLSKVRQKTLVSGGVRGTLPWMAPELLSGKSNMVTEKIDVYSFGIAMWELLTGEEPYSDMHCASIIGGIVNNTLRPQIPTWCDPEWKALMESCWSSDPGDRPSFSEISQKLRKMAAAINVK